MPQRVVSEAANLVLRQVVGQTHLHQPIRGVVFIEGVGAIECRRAARLARIAGERHRARTAGRGAAVRALASPDRIDRDDTVQPVAQARDRGVVRVPERAPDAVHRDLGARPEVMVVDDVLEGRRIGIRRDLTLRAAEGVAIGRAEQAEVRFGPGIRDPGRGIEIRPALALGRRGKRAAGPRVRRLSVVDEMTADVVLRFLANVSSCWIRGPLLGHQKLPEPVVPVAGKDEISVRIEIRGAGSLGRRRLVQRDVVDDRGHFLRPRDGRHSSEGVVKVIGPYAGGVARRDDQARVRVAIAIDRSKGPRGEFADLEGFVREVAAARTRWIAAARGGRPPVADAIRRIVQPPRGHHLADDVPRSGGIGVDGQHVTRPGARAQVPRRKPRADRRRRGGPREARDEVPFGVVLQFLTAQHAPAVRYFLEGEPIRPIDAGARRRPGIGTLRPGHPGPHPLIEGPRGARGLNLEPGFDLHPPVTHPVPLLARHDRLDIAVVVVLGDAPLRPDVRLPAHQPAAQRHILIGIVLLQLGPYQRPVRSGPPEVFDAMVQPIVPLRGEAVLRVLAGDVRIVARGRGMVVVDGVVVERIRDGDRERIAVLSRLAEVGPRARRRRSGGILHRLHDDMPGQTGHVESHPSARGPFLVSERRPSGTGADKGLDVVVVAVLVVISCPRARRRARAGVPGHQRRLPSLFAQQRERAARHLAVIAVPPVAESQGGLGVRIEVAVIQAVLVGLGLPHSQARGIVDAHQLEHGVDHGRGARYGRAVRKRVGLVIVVRLLDRDELVEERVG